MKIQLFSVTLLASLFICCSNVNHKQKPSKVAADELIANIDKYCGTEVETTGVITHICGVTQKKMKLQIPQGAVIKIVPQDSLECFDRVFYKKKIKVKGLVKEYRIERQYVDKMRKDKNLLCHIDHTPCIDSAWVKKHKNNGTADSLSEKDIKKLNAIMQNTEKNYVSVITIFANKCEIIE